MATPLTDAINALTTYANSVTGQSDTSLSDAVDSLVAGYGGGGGDDHLYDLVSGTITDSMIDWSQVTALREFAFAQCTALTSIGNPTVAEIKSSAFRSCSGLVTAELTTLKQSHTATDVFRYCTKLKTITLHFTHTGTISLSGNYVFANNAVLETIIIDAPNASAFNWNTTWQFYGSDAFRKIVLRPSFVVNLTGGANSNGLGGLYNNPTASTIYVPQSLISSYQAASNWSTLYNMGVTFAKIEGSQYEL